MNTTFKRLLSFAVALVMVLGLIPVTQLEAKAAETTTEQTQPETTTQSDAKDQSAELLNETQQPAYTFTGVLDADATGEIEAICPHCSQEAGEDVKVTWKPILSSSGKSSSDEYKAAQMPIAKANEHAHYYVPQNKDASGKVQGVYNNTLNVNSKTDGSSNSWFFMYLMNSGSSCCVHLNGSVLTTTCHAYLATSVSLNIMGDGVWQSTYKYVVSGKTAPFAQAWRGSVINVHGDSSTVNLYSGTLRIKEGSAVGQTTISLGAGGNAGKINIHKDAVVDGTVWGNLGTITLNGGIINGQVVLRGGNSAATNTATSRKPVFTMNSGTINGQVHPKTHEWVWPYMDGRGGAIFAAGAEVNINGGTIHGAGTEDAPFTADGGAIYIAGFKSAFMDHNNVLGTTNRLAAPATLNITGGTINGGVLENANGSAIYAAAADLMGVGYSSATINISGGTINGGKVTNGNGGAVYVSGIDQSNPVTTVSGGTINGGTVINGNGGAFYITDGGGAYKPRLDMSAGTINGGTVTGGNGGAVAGIGANLNLYGGTISGGTVTGGNGGAVSLQKGTIESALNMTGTTVQNGKAIPVVTYTAETETTKATGGLGGNFYLNALSSYVGTNDAVENKATVTGGEAYCGGNIYNTGSKQLTIRKNAVISYGEAKTYSDEQGHTVTGATGGNVCSTYTVACYGEVAYGTAASHGGNLYITSASATFNEGANIHHGTSGGNGGNIYNAWKLTLAKDTIVADGTAVKGGNIYYENNSADTYNLTTPNPNNGMNFSGVITRGTATTGGGGNIYSNHDSMNMNILAGEVSDGKCTGTDADEARGGNIYAYEGGTVNIGNNSGDAVVISGGEAEIGGSIYAKNLTVKKTGTVKDGEARAYGGNIAQAGGPVYIYGTVQDGKAGTYGGNMAVAGGYLVTIDGGQILRGEAETYGGNINSNNSGLLIKGDTLIDGGKAKNGDGGNIKIFGGTAAYTKLGLQVDSGTISNGKAEKGSGGNIIVYTSGTNVGKLTVNGGTISGGIAKQGGNIYLDAATSANINGGTISGGIAEATLTDYKSGYTGGGNIYMSGSVPVTVANATISGGVSASSAGNIMVQKAAVLTLNSGTVVKEGTANGTIAPSGGGNIQTSGGTININPGATVSGGTAPGGGTNVGLIYGGVLNLNGGVIGAETEKETDTVRVHRTDSAVNVLDGTVYGQVKLTDTAVATDIVVYHGQFTMDPTGLVNGEGVVVRQANGMYGVHIPGEGTANPAPGCTEGGKTDWTCTYTYTVGETTHDCVGYSVATEATDHDYKVTYTNDGETHTKVETCQNNAEHVITTAGQAHAYENGVCVCGAVEAVETNEAVVDGVKYEKFQDALAAAAAAGKPVQLLNDVAVEGDLVLTDGLVLDLNGKKLTVSGIVLATFTGNKIADTSDNNSGRLVAQISQLRMMDENGQLPVQMGDGIMFVDAASGNGKASASSNYQCWIADGADQALIDALTANKASELGLEFQVIMTWGNNTLKYTFSDETVALYMQAWQTNAMFLKVNGAENIEDLQYQARIVFADDTMAEVVLWAGNVVAHK